MVPIPNLTWWIFGLVVATVVGVTSFLVFHASDEKPTLDGLPTPGTMRIGFRNTGAVALAREQGIEDKHVLSASGLKSLQYHLLDVTMYEDIKVSGTAWNPSTDPTKQAKLTLYSNGNNASQLDYNTYGFAQALVDTTNYVDLADPKALAERLSFEIKLDESLAGKQLQWVVVNWMKPIKFQAEFYDADTKTTLVSKTASNFRSFTSNNFSIMDTSMASGTSQLTTIVLNNGGFFTRLAEPFVVDLTKTYRCLFAFNPDGVLKVAQNSFIPLSTDNNFASFEFQKGSAGDLNGNHVFVPMLPLAPIIYAEGDKVFKEVYILHILGSGLPAVPVSPPVPDSAKNCDIVLEVYYRESAPENVAAATAITRLTATSDLSSGFVQAACPTIFFIEKDTSNGKMNFRPYDPNYKLIHGLKRGESGSCQMFMYEGMAGYYVTLQNQVGVTITYDYQGPPIQVS